MLFLIYDHYPDGANTGRGKPVPYQLKRILISLNNKIKRQKAYLNIRN